MYRRIEQYCKKYRILEQDSRVVIGISGGPDSVCLLDFLCKIRREKNLTLYGVHIHHGLRGESADQDEQFTRQLCKQYEVPYYCFYEQVKERAEREKMGIEEAGRLCRYERMEEVRRKTGSDFIAVAHHGNDQAETVLFHLIRGSGLEGLKGILPKRDRIIRPLLCVTKKEILEYLNENALSYQIDETNMQSIHTRNKIRNQWIPMMEEMNQEAVAHLCQTAELMALASDYITKERELAYKKCVVMEESEENNDRKSICLSVPKLQREHIFLQLEILKYSLYQFFGGQNIGVVHIEGLKKLLDGETGKEVSLPKGVIAKKQYDKLLLSNRKEEKKEGYCYELMVPSSTYIQEMQGEIRLTLFDASSLWQNEQDFEQRISKDIYKKMFDYDKIKGRLELRTRRSHDVLSMDEFGRHKSLKRFFIDEKIPRQERETLPILADEKGILWLLGYRIGAMYKVEVTTKRVLLVEYEKRTKETKNG